jgi:hypothetical protein
MTEPDLKKLLTDAIPGRKWILVYEAPGGARSLVCASAPLEEADVLKVLEATLKSLKKKRPPTLSG